MADTRIHNALLSINPTTKRPAWHGAPSAIGLLRGVSPAVALWRPHPEMHNIREVALHIAFWENSAANSLSGESVRVGIADRETDWPPRIGTLDLKKWKTETRLVKTTHERLVRVVSGFDPKRLDKPTSPKSNRIAIELMHGIGEHSLYHAAQIKSLKLLARHAGLK